MNILEWIEMREREAKVELDVWRSESSRLEHILATIDLFLWDRSEGRPWLEAFRVRVVFRFSAWLERRRTGK